MLGVDRVKHTSLVGTIPVLEEEEGERVTNWQSISNKTTQPFLYSTVILYNNIRWLS